MTPCNWPDFLSGLSLGMLGMALLAVYAYRQWRPPQPRCPRCNDFLSDKRAHVCRR